jgi:hypothetical protein
MQGVYCIFDIEPNKDFTLGVLKISWLICKYQDQNLITLSTNEYFVTPDNPKFKNYDYKFHGISNKLLKLEGESIFYILDLFYEDLKTFEVDYLSGFKIKEYDLEYLYKLAQKHNITNLKKDFINKKFIIIDVAEYVGEWVKKNNLSIKISFEELYPYLFNKAQFPKTKYHNTTLECQHTRNILFKLLVDDITLFDDIEPLISDKINFKEIDQLKDLVDEQLLLDNDNLKNTCKKLETRILGLELEIEEYRDNLNIKNKIIEEEKTNGMNFRDEKIKAETKLSILEKQVEKLETELKNIYNQQQQIKKLEEENESLQEKILENRINTDKDNEFSQLIVQDLESKILELQLAVDDNNDKNQIIEDLKQELINEKNRFSKHEKISKTVIENLKNKLNNN